MFCLQRQRHTGLLRCHWRPSIPHCESAGFSPQSLWPLLACSQYRKKLRKVDTEGQGLHFQTLSPGLSKAVVSVGPEKQEVWRRDLNPQGLMESMGREKQRSLGTIRAAVAASVCRERQGNCRLDSGKRGPLGEMGCRNAPWTGLSPGRAKVEIKIHAPPSAFILPGLPHPLFLDFSNLGNLVIGIFSTSVLESKQISSLESKRFWYGASKQIKGWQMGTV